MYRGQNKNDGSLLLQRARPPARPQRQCLDTWDNNPHDRFTYTGAVDPQGHKILPTNGSFPLSVQVIHRDAPRHTYKTEQTNELTGIKNYLDEVQIELGFWTVLTVRDVAGSFHHLASFYWNLRWQNKFTPNRYPLAGGGWRIVDNAQGIGGARSRVTNRPPPDARIIGALTAFQARSCNAIDGAAASSLYTQHSPGRHAYRDRDHRPDVRR
jgi:hypothetical protein